MQDPLSDLLDAVRLEAAVCGQVALTAPWTLSGQASTESPFYTVQAGTALLQAGTAPPLRLAAGDYVVLPRGTQHRLQDAGTGNGAVTSLISGHLRLDRTRARALLRILPDILHLPGADGQPAEAVRLLAAAGEREATRPGPGSAAALKRVSELFFLQAVRAEIERRGGDGHICRAVAGAPQIAAALRLIRADPIARWSLAELAAQVGMSRSAFAAAFRATVGETPMQYLAGLRMARATELLRTPGLSIAEVAFQVGYGSDIAFARVFKRHYGIAPGAWRQPRPAVASGA